MRPLRFFSSLLVVLISSGAVFAQSEDCRAADLRTMPFDDFITLARAHSDREAEDTSGQGPDFSYLDVSTVLVAGPSALADLNLSGVDFTCAKLTGVDLTGTTLTETVFTGAQLDSANLSGAKALLADLRGASLVATTFNTNSSLVRAKLDGAILTGAVLDKVRMTGASLTDAILVDTHIEGADLSSTKVRGALWAPKGELSPDDVGGMTGMRDLRTGFCAARATQPDPNQCVSIVERPRVAALERLRQAFEDGDDRGAMREVTHVIERTRTEHAWARVRDGDVLTLPFAIYRSIWHDAFADHGLGVLRSIVFVLLTIFLFAAVYFVLHRKDRPRSLGGLFWLPRDDVKRVDHYNRIIAGDADDLWVKKDPKEAAWAALCYSLVATSRVGSENWSALSLIEKHLPFPHLASAVGRVSWIGGGQSLFIASLAAVVVYYAL